MIEINIETARALKNNLASSVVSPTAKRHIIEEWKLTKGGVVVGPAGWMHPMTFRDVFGEEEYQALLDRPRVIHEYDS